MTKEEECELASLEQSLKREGAGFDLFISYHKSVDVVCGALSKVNTASDKQLAVLRLARKAMDKTVNDAMQLPASGLTSRASIENVARMRIAIAAIDAVLPPDAIAELPPEPLL